MTTLGNFPDDVVLRGRDSLSCNISVRFMATVPLRKVNKMSLMVEDLARDRMRRMQRDAELSRVARRLQSRRQHSSTKNA